MTPETTLSLVFAVIYNPSNVSYTDGNCYVNTSIATQLVCPIL